MFLQQCLLFNRQLTSNFQVTVTLSPTSSLILNKRRISLFWIELLLPQREHFSTPDRLAQLYQREAIHLWQAKIHNKVKSYTTCQKSNKKHWVYPSWMRTKKATDPWNEKCGWVSSGCAKKKVVDRISPSYSLQN